MRLAIVTALLLVLRGAATAVEPGYLDFDNLPDTNFSCEGKVIGGYYADEETGCQMFHVCTIGQKGEVTDIKFLCLNGTVFDQETRVCERVGEVDCSKTEGFYGLNLELYGNSASFSLQDEEEEEDASKTQLEHQKLDSNDPSPSTHGLPLRSSTTSSTTNATPKTTTTTLSPIPVHPFVPTTTTRPQFHYMSSSTPSITSFLTYSSSDRSLFDGESEGSSNHFLPNGPLPSPWPQVNVQGGGGSGHINKGEHLHDTFHSLKTTPKPINLFSASFNRKSHDHNNPFVFSTTTHTPQHYFTTKSPVGFSITSHPSTVSPFSLPKQVKVYPTISTSAVNTSPGYLKHHQGISKDHATNANSGFLGQQPQNIHLVQNPLHFQFNNRPSHQIFTTPSIAIVSSTSSTSSVSSIKMSVKNTEPQSNNSPSSVSVNSFAFGINSGLNSAGFINKGLVQNGTVTVTVNGQQYGETTPPNSYDEYHESDVSLDPFFRDVPRIAKQPKSSRKRRQIVDTVYVPLGMTQSRGKAFSTRVEESTSGNRIPQQGRNYQGRTSARPEVQQHTSKPLDTEIYIPASDITISKLSIPELVRDVSKNIQQHQPAPKLDVQGVKHLPSDSIEDTQNIEQYQNQKLTRVVQLSNTFTSSQQPSPERSSVSQRRRHQEYVLKPHVDRLLGRSAVPEVRRTHQHDFRGRVEPRVAAHSRTKGTIVQEWSSTTGVRQAGRGRKLHEPEVASSRQNPNVHGANSPEEADITLALAPAVKTEPSGRRRNSDRRLTSSTTESIPNSTSPTPLPQTSFTCKDKVPGGYYADLEADCQLFHICSQGRHGKITDNKFLCGPGTRFNQLSRTCQVRDMVDCSLSASLYHLNSHFLQPADDVPAPELDFEPQRIQRTKRATRKAANEGGPDFSIDTLPKTSFTCADKPQEGLFADVETQCQGFHLCRKENSSNEYLSLVSTFVCPHGTVFNQFEGYCDSWREVDCNLYSAPEHSFGHMDVKSHKMCTRRSYTSHINAPRMYSKTSTQHLKMISHPLFPQISNIFKYHSINHKNSHLHPRSKREVLDTNNETEENYDEYEDDKYEVEGKSEENKQKVSTGMEAYSSEISGPASLEKDSFQGDSRDTSSMSISKEDEEKYADSSLESRDEKKDDEAINEQDKKDAAQSEEDPGSGVEVTDDSLESNTKVYNSQEIAVSVEGNSDYTTDKGTEENSSREVSDEAGVSLDTNNNKAADSDSLENNYNTETDRNDYAVNNKNKFVGKNSQYLDFTRNKINGKGSIPVETHGDSVEYTRKTVEEKSGTVEGGGENDYKLIDGISESSSEEETTQKVQSDSTAQVNSESVEVLKYKVAQLLKQLNSTAVNLSNGTEEVESQDYEYYDDYYVDSDKGHLVEITEKPTTGNTLIKENNAPLYTAEKELLIATTIKGVFTDDADVTKIELPESVTSTTFHNRESDTESVSENVTDESEDRALTHTITTQTEGLLHEVGTFKGVSHKHGIKAEDEVSTTLDYYLTNKISQSINKDSEKSTKAVLPENETSPYPLREDIIHDTESSLPVKSTNKIYPQIDMPTRALMYGDMDATTVVIPTQTLKSEKPIGNVPTTPAFTQVIVDLIPTAPDSDVNQIETLKPMPSTNSTSSHLPSASPVPTIPSLFHPSKLRPVYHGRHSTPVPLPVVIRPKDALMARKPSLKRNRHRGSTSNKISTETPQKPKETLEGVTTTTTAAAPPTTTIIEEPTTITNLLSETEQQPTSRPAMKKHTTEQVTIDSLITVTKLPEQNPTLVSKESNTKSIELSPIAVTALPPVEAEISSETQVGPPHITDSLAEDTESSDYDDNTPSHVLPTFSGDMFHVKHKVPIPLLQSTSQTSSINHVTAVPDVYISSSGFGSTVSSLPPLQSDYTLSLINAQTTIPGHSSDKDFSFSCLSKDLNKYYADPDNCHLFHYCSPGFHRRQVLDFRFMCEGGTAFSMEMQKCENEQNVPRCDIH